MALTKVSAVMREPSLILHVRDEKSAGTGGGTFTNGAWRTRVLNTIKTNTIPGASVSSNAITLPAGTYFIDATAPAAGVNIHKAKLVNTSDASDVIIGTSEDCNIETFNTSSRVRGQFTIAAEKTFEIQSRCQITVADYGFGNTADLGGVIEVYTDVLITKLI